ncbi:MAG: carboxylesterase family protein, partial [Oscillospiraceae bacterium]|nr:carboxylesterase family protein [Oscillospiraceae bacterium]
REYGLPSWEYVFARRLTAQGAFHGMEIPYTFSTLDAEPDFGKPLPYTSDDRQLSALMHSYWVNFIKKFDPNGGGLPFWPEKSQGDLHMQFDAVSEVRDDIIRDTDRTVTPAVDQWMRSRIRN